MQGISECGVPNSGNEHVTTSQMPSHPRRTCIKLWSTRNGEIFTMAMCWRLKSWELDYKESWAPKNWCFWTVVSKKTPESPLDCKEIKSVSPNGNQSWILIERTDAEVEAPTFWPPDAKNWLIGKDLDAGKDGRQEEKGTTEDEMVGWHHWLDGHEFEQVLGVDDG